ncbi:hypothetical protein [Aquipuribacter sp. SD81]|uniref:hypothetical protein n=1 Tax=Aquipuribacter sp. SD81 TaxID=3127703 RepID=UPI00301AE42E
MTGPLVALLVGGATVVMVWGLVAARRDRAPGRALLLLSAALGALLLVQALVAVVLLVDGTEPVGSTVLFVSYLVTVVLVLPGAVGWVALDEPDRWSSAVLAVAGLTVAVMVLRLWSLWSGVQQIGAPPGA